MNQPINRSPKTSYYIRIAAGGYLLYTAYSLNTDWATVKPEHKLGIGAAIVLFAIAGFILCLVSSISLIKYNKTQSENEEDTGDLTDTPEYEHTDILDSEVNVSEEKAIGTEEDTIGSEASEGNASGKK